MRYKKRLLFFSLLGMAFLSAACGKKTVSKEKSPQLVDAEIQSYSEGSEDSQFVEVDLIFDKEISVADTRDSLRVTISGERIKEDAFTLQMGEDEGTASLLIPVEAVTSGVLKIQRSEKADTIEDIMDAGGTYAVQDFTLEGIIPSGVSLSTVETESGKVVKRVESLWDIRSIAWAALYQDDTLIPVSETQQGEQLDGYAAVHGHEFLIEDEKDIAEKIAETLKDNYAEGFRFTSEDDTITAQSVDGEGELDIRIYQYLRINGEEIEKEDAEEATADEEEHVDEHEDEHGSGLKIKVMEKDREISPEEQVFVDALRISGMEAGEDGIKDGAELYASVTITGTAMPEEQIYSVYDLETLFRDSFQNKSLYEFGLPVEYDGHYGIHFPTYLELCGVDTGQEGLLLLFRGKDGEEKTYSMEELQEGQSMLALGSGEATPLSLLVFREGETESVEDLTYILAGSEGDMSDPAYGFHEREPFLDSKDLTFTIEVYQQGAEYLGAVTTKEFTTEGLEELLKEHPEAAAGNYYGTLGNAELFKYMGIGGWLDHFEGIDLKWLLTEQMGLGQLEGYGEFIGRDGEVYAEVEDLAYIDGSEDAEEYYVLTSEGVRIPGTVPMIAFAKNGYPLLPEHDHESEGYIAYNQLNQKLEEAGISTEVGVVKNHSGPFVACLGNRDGYYGGNEKETGGDCVKIRLYLKN